MTAKQMRKQASMPDEIMIMIWLDYQPYTRYSGCLPIHDSPTYRRSTPSHGLIACQFYQWSLECNRWYEAFNDRVPHKFSCTDYHTGGQYIRGWLNRFQTSNNIELFLYLVRKKSHCDLVNTASSCWQDEEDSKKVNLMGEALFMFQSFIFTFNFCFQLSSKAIHDCSECKRMIEHFILQNFCFIYFFVKISLINQRRILQFYLTAGL